MISKSELTYSTELIYSTDVFLNLFFIEWNEVEKWLCVQYYVYFWEDETHPSFTHNWFFIPQIKNFAPYFSEWIKFLGRELKKMDVEDRLAYSNEVLREIELMRILHPGNAESSFLDMLSSFLRTEVEYVTTKIKVDSIRLIHIPSKGKVKIDYSNIFCSDSENEFSTHDITIPDHLIHFVMFFVVSKETGQTGYPSKSVAKLWTNLENLEEARYSKAYELKVPETLYSFKMVGNTTIKEKRLKYLYDALTQKTYDDLKFKGTFYTFLDRDTKYDVFKQMHSGCKLSKANPLGIKITFPGRNSKSNLQALLFYISLMAEFSLIERLEASSYHRLYDRFSCIFIDLNGEPINKESLKGAKHHISQSRLEDIHQEWAEVLKEIVEKAASIK